MGGLSPTAEAAVAAHLVRDGVLALAQGVLPPLRRAQDVEAPLALADAFRVEEHKCAVLVLEAAQRCAFCTLKRHNCQQIVKMNHSGTGKSVPARIQPPPLEHRDM